MALDLRTTVLVGATLVALVTAWSVFADEAVPTTVARADAIERSEVRSSAPELAAPAVAERTASETDVTSDARRDIGAAFAAVDVFVLTTDGLPAMLDPRLSLARLVRRRPTGDEPLMRSGSRHRTAVGSWGTVARGEPGDVIALVSDETTIATAVSVGDTARIVVEPGELEHLYASISGSVPAGLDARKRVVLQGNRGTFARRPDVEGESFVFERVLPGPTILRVFPGLDPLVHEDGVVRVVRSLELDLEPGRHVDLGLVEPRVVEGAVLEFTNVAGERIAPKQVGFPLGRDGDSPFTRVMGDGLLIAPLPQGTSTLEAYFQGRRYPLEIDRRVAQERFVVTFGEAEATVRRASVASSGR